MTDPTAQNPRLIFLTPEPTQHASPWYRYVSRAEFNLSVLVVYTEGLEVSRDPEIERVPGWDLPLLEGYEYQVLPGPVFRRLSHLWRALRGRPAVVFLPGWRGLVPWITVVFSIFLRHKTIVECDATSWQPRGKLRATIRKILVGRILGTLVGSFAAPGTLTREHLAELGVDRSKVCWLPYPVDIEWFEDASATFRPQAESLRSNIGVTSKNPIVLLGVLKFVDREGAIDLLQAFGRVADRCLNAWLILVGAGEQEAKLRVLALEKGRGRTLFAGYHPYSALPRFYALADCFVHPALDEPWGISVLEAAACGLPIVATDRVGAAADLLFDRINGFRYSAGDVGRLADLLVAFCEMPEEARHEMGRKSRVVARSWAYDRMLASVLNVFAGRHQGVVDETWEGIEG